MINYYLAKLFGLLSMNSKSEYFRWKFNRIENWFYMR